LNLTEEARNVTYNVLKFRSVSRPPQIAHCFTSQSDRTLHTTRLNTKWLLHQDSPLPRIIFRWIRSSHRT